MIVVCAWILGTSPRMTKEKVRARVPRSAAEDGITEARITGDHTESGTAGCTPRHDLEFGTFCRTSRFVILGLVPRIYRTNKPFSPFKWGMIRCIFRNVSIT
ncbi:hypothetical protein YH62_21915 [Rhizobium sp. LC145]|nr:hypothetical protein YH62_21915 [Rhizobium sp. LC145]